MEFGNRSLKSQDLIKRASEFEIKVYTQIIYQYLRLKKAKGLRKLVRDIEKIS